MKRFLLFIIHCSLFIAVAGCGGSGVSFTGVVKNADGSPCSGAVVSFSGTKYQYDGATDANGKYKLVGATVKDGIEPGKYQVSVTKSDGDTGKSLIPAKYGSPDTSGLVCEVKGSGTFDITLENNAKK
jgi:hypothetical protein